MRTSFTNTLVLASCLILLAACCDCAAVKTAPRHSYGRTKAGAAIVNPETESPKSHKTCTEDFKFKQGTPQYDKCVSSLSQIEDKSE